MKYDHHLSIMFANNIRNAARVDTAIYAPISYQVSIIMALSVTMWRKTVDNNFSQFFFAAMIEIWSFLYALRSSGKTKCTC